MDADAINEDGVRATSNLAVSNAVCEASLFTFCLGWITLSMCENMSIGVYIPARVVSLKQIPRGFTSLPYRCELTKHKEHFQQWRPSS